MAFMGFAGLAGFDRRDGTRIVIDAAGLTRALSAVWSPCYWWLARRRFAPDTHSGELIDAVDAAAAADPVRPVRLPGLPALRRSRRGRGCRASISALPAGAATQLALARLLGQASRQAAGIRPRQPGHGA